MHTRKFSQKLGGYKKFPQKKYSSKADFMDTPSSALDEDIYTSSRDKNVLYDIYSNTANSSSKKKMFFGKKKNQIQLEEEELNDSRL
jgi:hypothetical protein